MPAVRNVRKQIASRGWRAESAADESWALDCHPYPSLVRCPVHSVACLSLRNLFLCKPVHVEQLVEALKAAYATMHVSEQTADGMTAARPS